MNVPEGVWYCCTRVEKASPMIYPMTARINRSGCVKDRVKQFEFEAGPWWFQSERVRLWAQRAAPGTWKPDTMCWDVYLELWSCRLAPVTPLATDT